MQNIDNIFSEFAKGFTGKVKGDGDIAYPNKLKRESLDFSLESLKKVDEYLCFLYNKKNKIKEQEYSNVIHWCGAYIGEVMKTNSRQEYHWIDYKEFVNQFPNIAKMIPLYMGTKAILADSVGNMSMPMNKVVRFIEEGNAHSVYYFAFVFLSDKRIIS